MIRIKTENKYGTVHTIYLESTKRWYSLFNPPTGMKGDRRTLEASSLLEAGQNHLELCKGYLL